GDGEGHGTGFFVRDDGIIATNSHVIADVPDRLEAVFRDGRRVRVIGVLADDEEHDLALVRIEGRGYPPLDFAPTDAIKVGERLTLVGSPLGFAQSVAPGSPAPSRPDYPEQFKKREGRASRKSAGPLVQHTVSSAPGASGSPLVDDLGRVVGVNHSGFFGTDVNFGAHVDALRALIAKTNLEAPPRPLGPNRHGTLAISAIFFSLLAAILLLGLRRRRAVHSGWK